MAEVSSGGGEIDRECYLCLMANKLTAWHDSYDLLIRGEKSFYNSRLSQGDRFYRFFLSDACLGKACYERCKYKYDRSAADIRIGDLWGKPINRMRMV